MGRQYRAILIAALVSAVLSALVNIASYGADRDSARLQHTRVAARLESIRANFQESINFRVELLDSIVGEIRNRASDSTREVLESIEHLLLASDTDRFLAAPNSRVAFGYPAMHAEKFAGVDLLRIPVVSEAVEHTISKRSATTVSYPLINGDNPMLHIVAPVFISSDGYDTYWGVVILSVDVQQVLRDAGIFDVHRIIELGARPVDQFGNGAEPIFGHVGIFYSDFETREVFVPGGALQLAALPRMGWSGSRELNRFLKYSGFLAALSMGLIAWMFLQKGSIPFWVKGLMISQVLLITSIGLGWLVSERNREIERNRLVHDLASAVNAIDLRLAENVRLIENVAQTQRHRTALAETIVSRRKEIATLFSIGMQSEVSRLASRGDVSQAALDEFVEYAQTHMLRPMNNSPLDAPYHKVDHDGTLYVQKVITVLSEIGGESALIAVYDIANLLRASVPLNMLRDHHVSIVNNDGEHIVGYPPVREIDNRLTQRMILFQIGRDMYLRMGRYQHTILDYYSILIIGLIVILVITLLMSIPALEKTQHKLRELVRQCSGKLASASTSLQQNTVQSLEIAESLEVSEQNYANIFNGSHDAIFVIDPLDDKIIDANRRACEMLEYEHNDLLQVAVSRIYPREMKRLQSMLALIISRDGPGDCRFNCLTQSGKSIPVELSASSIRYASRTCMLVIAHDTSQRVARESELKQALADLENLKNRLHEEALYLRDEIKVHYNFEEIVYVSDAVRDTLIQVEKVAKTDTTVLIQGETGTGKELFARAIHSTSDRSDRPLVKVNCATLPENLIESELFGHERGAFSGATSRKSGRFELANRGTIFLDEIGELPLHVQAKLLRILQEGEFERLGSSRTLSVDVRIIAATNRNLAQAMGQGDFRSDLFYRLNVFPVHCPPLREREGDIPVLVKYFVDKYGVRMGRVIETIPQILMDRFHHYHWPGNVRELENIIERAVVTSSGNKLHIDEQFDVTVAPFKPSQEVCPIPEMEKIMICKALETCDWVIEGKRGAALMLGIAPSTLRERIRKYNIKRKLIALV